MSAGELHHEILQLGVRRRARIVKAGSIAACYAERVPLAADIGDRIVAARKRAGLTRQQLADRIDTTAASLSLYERGHRSPSVERLVEIAEALGIEPGALLDGVRSSP